jgi:translocation and assembly module TamB
VRRRKWILAALGTAVLLGWAAVAVISSDWFAERIRQTIVARTETATGGKTELKSFRFDWRTMRVTVTGFTLHGLEAADKAPLFSAPEITLDLQVVSFLRRDVILRGLTVKRPSIHIYVDGDGATNLPSPAKPDPKSDPIASLLSLKIRRLEIEGGLFEYDRRPIPFHLIADQFAAGLDYQPRGPAYLASVSSNHLRMNDYDGIGFDARLKLEAGKIGIERALVRRMGAEAIVQGELTDFKNPVFAATVKASQPLAELGITGVRRGTATWDAAVRFDGSGYSARGPISVIGLGWQSAAFRLDGAAIRGEALLENGVVTLERATASALGGTWSGKAELRDWHSLKLDGVLSGVSLAAALGAIPDAEFPWDGSISGPVSLTARIGANGLIGTVAEAQVEIAPAADRLPAEGSFNLRWTESNGLLTLSDSVIRLPATELRVSGILGQSLNASLSTRDLAEVETAAGLFIADSKALTPYLRLNGGSARVDAVIDGPLNDPVFSGRAELTRFASGGVDFDSAVANFRIASNHLHLRRIDFTHAGARSSGEVAVTLDNWRVQMSAPMRATMNLRGVDAADLAGLAGIPLPGSGRLNAQATVEGTPDAPLGTLRLEWRDAVVGSEKFKLITANLKTEVGPALALSGEVRLDGDPLIIEASFEHPKADWQNGRLRVHLDAKKLRLAQIETVRQLRDDLAGDLQADIRAEIAFVKGQATLSALTGFVSAPLASGARPLGAFRLDASTANQVVLIRAQGDIGGHDFGGESRIRLSAGNPIDGRIALPRIPFSALQLAFAESSPEPWPFLGFVGGDITFKGTLSDPSKMTARLVVTRLQVAPREGSIIEADVESSELVLRNASPITIDIDSSAAYIRSARLLAKDTSLTIAGLYSFSSRSPVDLSLNGTVNLEVLSTFEPDLIASGTASVSANMRGDMENPSINGQMKIKGGSFFLRDLANGIDNASGTIFFDRDRAQIDNLTGQTGGGNFKINGFVGFGQRELSYRLSAEAEAVRIRYPEGVSTTADASLTLTGSSNRSLLAGLVTIRKSGFNMKQDLGSIITGSSNPIPVPATQNAFLRNLQFDVRVRTSANATFQTSYTRDLQTRADLRLRGSPAKPVILGSVEVNQGEVLFFGNQYTISRGELLFFNTAVIQPSINLDLETRIRGVTVYLNVSGPLSRLDVNYRSEPPLQSQEILALLTVGRAPTATSSTIPASISSRSSVLGESNANTLLGGALSASVSSRVQKFFGASRIKIDPNVTGVENLPQARLTIEQSLSRNVIFTYSINLSRSSQQVVRMEWDLSNDWSLIAVRDENGAFGVDFLFRHRFK